MSIKDNYPEIKPSLNLSFALTKKLDPRISFARASTARYYDGRSVAKAEENLFQYSQEFDNAYWTKTRATVTANNTVAPDGTTTADLVSQNAGQTSSGSVSRSFTGSTNAFVISIFAKKEAKDFIIIREEFSSSSAKSTWFNISTGTVGTTASGHTASITSVGNGWYRCTIAFTADATRTGSVVFYLADTDGSTTVTDSGGIYLWGAQLEQRSSVTAYTPTTTQPITNYIPVLQTASANVARFDHDPVTGESLGLLVEEQRTNLLTYSEDFSNASWVKARSSIAANTVVAPDGTLTGDKLVEDTTTNNSHFCYVSNSSSGQHTLTVYAKAGERNWLVIASAGFGVNTAWFDISTGVSGGLVGFSSSSIVSVGNGWYRCSATIASLGNSFSFVIGVSNANNIFTYTGDGYSGIYIWGAQLEAGSFPTSYIPTTSSQVTRSADSASMTGANFEEWYRADEGTMFAEVNLTYRSATPKYPRVVAITGTPLDDNEISLYSTFDGSTVGSAVASVVVSGSIQVGSVAVNNVTAWKAALGYKTNDFAVSANGNASVSDTSGVLPKINQLIIMGAARYQPQPSGHIKKIAYYPLRLSNANLQALTGS